MMGSTLCLYLDGMKHAVMQGNAAVGARHLRSSARGLLMITSFVKGESL